MPDALKAINLRAFFIILVALQLAVLWGFSGFTKLAAGGVPSWFAEQFGGTILAKLPGLTLSFYSIAILESVACLLALGSLFRGEFIRTGPPTVLYAALLLSLLLFVQLSVGKNLLGDFAGIHDLFVYFAGTAVLLHIVRSMTPDTRKAETH